MACSAAATAQVLPQDSLALVAFYNSTGGPDWNNNTNWLTGPVSIWYGITVEGNRVTGLIINSNNLSGVLPDDLGQLTALQSLGMSNDHELTGEIPVNLFQINTLVWFGIGNCSLTGTIPNNIGNCSLLKSIELWENNLSGPIPSEIGNLDSLKFLDLHGNQLTGQIPPELGNCTSLWELWLNDNELTGTIPEEVSYLDNLQILNVSNNLLSGKLPEYLSNLFYQNPPFYISLFVSDNLFSGSVPESWGNLSFLIDALDLSNNKLTSLPEVNYNWVMTFFQINDNKLTFEHIESHYQSYLQGLYYFFDYYPQDDMLEEIDTALAPGCNYYIYSGTGGEYTNYKWYKNGELILESPEADTLYLTDISYADTGIYTCIAENSLAINLTLQRRPVHIIIDTGTNIINYHLRKNISIYPNPASEKISVIMPYKAENINIKIIDIQGRCVLKLNFKQYNNATINLAIKEIKPGIYFLNAQTEKRNYSAKLIINKRGTRQ
jgi:hypothetical protein